MKKALVCFAVAASAFAVPVLSFAQSTAPLTRADVRADLIRVEQAGYNPSTSDDATYPADIQAAEAKIATHDNVQTAQSTDSTQTAQASQSAYGGVVQGSQSSSGKPVRMPMSSDCVGPVSFCNTFFGS